MPTQAIAARDSVAGAYINCWIQAGDAIDAERRAREVIAEEDWIVVSVEASRSVDLDSDIHGPDALYIREAIESGVSLVFHSWPPNGEERVG